MSNSPYDASVTRPGMPSQSSAEQMAGRGIRSPVDPAAGKPIKEFVDGIPIDPATGYQMQSPPPAAMAEPIGATAVPPGSSGKDPSWTQQLKMPEQSGAAPELTSPVPEVSGPCTGPLMATPDEARAVAASPDERIPVPTLDAVGQPPSEPVVIPANPDDGATDSPTVLPAIPMTKPAASGKCITEGCNCKVKDHGMCARCLKDTLAYMAEDKDVTWKFLEANGLALRTSSVSSGSKFRAGLEAKLTALHATPDGSKQS